MIMSWIPVMIALTGQAVPPPQTAPPATVQTAPRPVPKQFNETADAKAQIDKAVHGANEDGIRALLIWGANDSDRCLAFETVRKTVKGTFWADEYKVASIDVGKLDKNVDLAKSYGVTLKAEDLPLLTVLDGQGKVVANVSSRDFETGTSTPYDATKLAAFLTRHQAPNPDANKEFELALAQAKKDNKVLFLWYTAPW